MSSKGCVAAWNIGLPLLGHLRKHVRTFSLASSLQNVPVSISRTKVEAPLRGGAL